MIELVRAGRTFRTHGLEGKISFEVDPAFVNCIREGEALFFDVDGNSVPFFISSVESNGDEYLILSTQGGIRNSDGTPVALGYPLAYARGLVAGLLVHDLDELTPESPGLIRPAQRTMQGTRKPPS